MIQKHMRWKVAEKKTKPSPKRLYFSHKDSLTIARYMDSITQEHNKIDGASNGVELGLRMWHFVIGRFPEVKEGQWSLVSEGDVFIVEREVK